MELGEHIVVEGVEQGSEVGPRTVELHGESVVETIHGKWRVSFFERNDLVGKLRSGIT